MYLNLYSSILRLAMLIDKYYQVQQFSLNLGDPYILFSIYTTLWPNNDYKVIYFGLMGVDSF